MSVKAVVFDIGNVLIEWQPERHYDRIMPRETREQQSRRAWCTSTSPCQTAGDIHTGPV